MEPVVIRGKWTRKEYVRAYRRWYRVQRVDWIYLAFMLFLGILAHEILQFLIAGLVLSLLGIAWVTPNGVWLKNKSLREEGITTVDDNGISRVRPSSSTQIDWTDFKSSREFKDFYIVRPRSGRSSAIFRKRSLTSSHDEARLRAFLRAHTESSLRPNSQLDSLVSD